MAGALAGTLLIDIATDVAKLKQGFGEAQKTMQQFGQSVERIGGLFKTAMAAFGVGVSIGGLEALVDSVGAIGEQADGVALTTDAFQAFTAALRDAGVSAEATTSLLGKAAKNFGMALEGNKEQIEFFKRLNVGLIDAKGNAATMEDVMQRTAQAILAVEDPARRVALASQYMGKSGKDAIPALEQIAKGAGELARIFAKEIIPKEIIERFDKFGDRLRAMKAEVRKEAALAINDFFTPELMAELDRLATAFGNMAKSLVESFNSNGSAAEGFTKVLKSTNTEIETLVGWYNSIAENETVQSALREITLSMIEFDAATASAVASVRDFLQLGGDQFRAHAEHLRAQIEIRRAAADELAIRNAIHPPGAAEPPPLEITITKNKPTPTGFPTPTGGGGVDKFAEAMKKLREETRLTELAIKEFNELTAAGVGGKEAAKQAKLLQDIGKARADILKDIPKGVDTGPIQDMAEKLVKLKFNLDELKESQKVADEVNKEYGDGTQELRDRLEELSKAYAENRIKADEYAEAVRAANEAQKKQQIKSQENKEGWDGFVAGMQNAQLQLEEYVKTSTQGEMAIIGIWNLASDALSEFITTGEFNFKKLAAGFAKMLADMVAKWLVAQAILAGLRMLGAAAGGGGGLGGGSGMTFSLPAPPSGGMRAGGGPVSAGRAYMVGEMGPETFVPGTAGNIQPNKKEGLSVVVNNNAPGVTIGTEQTDDGNLAITVDRVRKSLTRDVARGGNMFSQSIERAYGVSRAAGSV